MGTHDTRGAKDDSAGMPIALFTALLNKMNGRGHPILAALLYVFCPAAARWWQAGADPVIPDDPVWRALVDLASGETLRHKLVEYGFESLVDAAKKYVDQVDVWRRQHPGVRAPETLPTFYTQQREIYRQSGHRREIKKFGGAWENFFRYVRTWAFLIRDWEVAMQFSGLPAFSQVRLALILPGIRRPVYFPAWSWMNAMPGASRVAVGLVGPHDQLLLGLARRADREGHKPWPSRPEIWALEGVDGTVASFSDRLPKNALPDLVQQLAAAAQQGPHPPVRALRGGAGCVQCGYRAQCYSNRGRVTVLSLSPENNAYSR